MRNLGCVLSVLCALSATADAGVLCRKPSGALAARDTVCKKKETTVDLAAYGGGNPLAGLTCASGDGLRWTGTAWACVPPPLPTTCPADAPLTWNGTAWVCGPNVTVPGDLAVGGTADLLGNGAADGRIVPFTAGDPQLQTNATYDSANAARLPVYWTTEVGTGDVTALCRRGDQLLSGGCVVSGDTCYVQRTYPIIVAATGQSGWHCRELDRVSGAACANLTVLSLCLKGF